MIKYKYKIQCKADQGPRGHMLGARDILQNTKYKIQNRKYKIENTKYKTQNTKYKIQNTKYKIQNTKYRIQNTKHNKLRLIESFLSQTLFCQQRCPRPNLSKLQYQHCNILSKFWRQSFDPVLLFWQFSRVIIHWINVQIWSWDVESEPTSFLLPFNDFIR